MTSFIMWYNSKTHKKTRYFVGIGKVSCLTHGHHIKPTWDYEKDNATIIDGEHAALEAKKFATECGYNGLILEPIDEDKAHIPPVSEAVH